MTGGPRTAGFTLIELVVALAIFALVAVMGVQGLTGMLRMRDGLDARAAAAEDLGRAVALLRADLTAALPILFHPPGQATPQSALRYETAAAGPVLALTVGGQPALEGPGRPGAGIGRAEWRLETATGRLSRHGWTTLTPADASARSPAMPVLEGVRALTVSSFWDGLGWVEGVRPPAQAAARTPSDDDSGPVFDVYSSLLPAGVRVTLDLEGAGPVVLVESLK